ncbi:spore coat protein [Clostridium sp. DJ247]|uniref:spore coat protein n=1 Tax=Clostridium sp. DJ247 TaxID=2726188 RepID=UPI0016255E33|nr:spore coat protein [Clostridium sp. DJ247]MBC2581335.1 spore coat protein [Clostridium sp. DJ247]
MDRTVAGVVGTTTLTDQNIASDFLNAAKAGIRNCAWAISEAATPEVRDALHKQLDDAIATHEKITRYMLDKKYYLAYNPEEQIRADIEASNKALDLQS